MFSIKFVFLNLFLYSINSQLIFDCHIHTDCFSGMYCNNQYHCENCCNLNTLQCDAVNNNCCDTLIGKQCKNIIISCNPPDDSDQIKISNSKLFLITISITSFIYCFLGIYYNKYILNYQGWNILPNFEFWKNIVLLVKDGITYTGFLISSRIKYTSSYQSIDE